MKEEKPRPKFVNEKARMIYEATQGLLSLSPGVQRLGESNVITIRNPDKKRVHLLTGGGSGHEPSHAGFVGKGLLSAAVCGNVFSSPTAQDVYEGIKAVGGEAGVLVIIKNYQGDVINFELAASRAKADGIKVATLHVGEDVTFAGDQEKGRWRESARGLCGTVVLYKILGKLAESGKTLEELVSVGRDVISNLYTFGASLTSVAPPFQPEISPICPEEIEIGLGVHGERGARTEPFKGSADTIETILKGINGAQDLHGARVAVVLNNLGGTSELEMGILTNDLISQLSKDYKAQVLRFSSGTFMTSLDMKGFSVTVLTFQENNEKLFLSGLDHPSFSGKMVFCAPIPPEEKPVSEAKESGSEMAGETVEEDKWHVFFRHLFEKLISNEAYLNELDAAVGDGDLGANVALCSAEILEALKGMDFEKKMASSIRKIGEIVSAHFGGTSGAIYSIFLLESSLALKETGNGAKEWIEGLRKGVEGVKRIGGAVEGDRTCLDVLVPVLREAEIIMEGKSTKKLEEAARDAEEKARTLGAKKGRSRYLAGKEIGLKDPGCCLALIWLSEVSQFTVF